MRSFDDHRLMAVGTNLTADQGGQSGKRDDVGSWPIDIDNVDATCAELARRGVQLLDGPMDRPWGIRTASFMDPGGHIWEIAK
jgi:uncharacterized glyoxalase superfamily protein PhnB